MGWKHYRGEKGEGPLICVSQIHSTAHRDIDPAPKLLSSQNHRPFFFFSALPPSFICVFVSFTILYKLPLIPSLWQYYVTICNTWRFLLNWCHIISLTPSSHPAKIHWTRCFVAPEREDAERIVKLWSEHWSLCVPNIMMTTLSEDTNNVWLAL